MKALTLNQSSITMSSKDIAELTRKRHDHILRDIRVMLSEVNGADSIPKFEDTLVHPQNGQSYPIFRLPKRETLILVSGYSMAMRASIIDRWQELELANMPRIVPSNFADALQLAADIEKEREAIQARLDIAEPKASALDVIADSEGMWCLVDAAKILQVEIKFLIAFMEINNWTYRRGVKVVARQDKLSSGWLKTKIREGGHGVMDQVFVTPSGLARLAVIMGKELPEAVKG